MAAVKRSKAPAEEGWRTLLAHLSGHKPEVQALAAFLGQHRPDMEGRQARRIAANIRSGLAINKADVSALPDGVSVPLMALLDAVRATFFVEQKESGQARRELDLLRLQVAAEDRERLKALREMGNGRALSDADQKLACMRTVETIEAWLEMGRKARMTWFARVEAALLARDKTRSADAPAWIDATYRRMYISSRREVATLTDYDILGIDVEADEATIRRAYRDAAKLHHPDVNGDERRFKQMHAAYQRLMGET
ncbi:MAG: J domain-containing protein [Candidatus Sericytochromatia bacterium]|nr:J domain-containing protein [Candidatus Sericytochromatia bacterium]